MDSWLVVLFFTLLGACLGSFLNVVAGRSVAGTSWWGGSRSKCPRCGAVLCWRDLVPVLSWVLLRGRCRYCGGRIAFRYAGAEICGAAMGGLLAWRWGLSVSLLLSLAAADEQDKILALIIKKGLNVRDTEKLIQGSKAKLQEKKPVTKDRYLADLERALAAKLMAKVQIRGGSNKGAIEVSFKSMDELNRLAGLILDGLA